MNQSQQANEVMKKMVDGYKNNPAIKEDADSWKFTDNQILRSMYDSIMIKINNEELQFEERYPVNKFKSMSGELKIVGLSPNNDTHIFETINNNSNLEQVTYYYYDKLECEEVKKLLNNFNETLDRNVEDFFNVLI